MVTKERQSIPKVIHQTYRSKILPLVLVDNINKIKAMNPEWQHRLYDDLDIENYLSKHFPWAVTYFKRINPVYGAVKADFFRYFLMYNEGGVYLDIKSSASKPLNDVINVSDRYLLSHWNNGPGEEFEGVGIYSETPLPRGEFQQWHIVAAPRHPFLKKTIERIRENFQKYDPYVDGVGARAVHRLSGPIAYTLSILPLLELSSEYRVADSINDLGFMYTAFEGNYSHEKLLYRDIKHYSEQRSSILKGNMFRRIKSYPPYRLRRWKARIGRFIPRLCLM